VTRVACLLALGALATVCACSKPGNESAGAASSASSSAASPSVAQVAASIAASSAPSSAPVRAARTWKGAYKSTAATLSVPAALSKEHWSDTQSTAGLGDGTLVVKVDGNGHVTGEVQGVLGPADLEGLSTDGKLSASIRRKDPTDRGFTGTLVATVTGDHGDGTMSVSLGQASALRVATFSLAPEAAP
jgi:hypothetical protein